MVKKRTMPTHLIEKQILHLQLHGQDHTWERQQTVAERLQSEGLQVLEEVFDQIADGDQMVCLDKLELDLGAFSLDEPAGEWKDRLRRTLLDALQAQTLVGYPDEGEAPRSREGAAWEAWLYFLEHGRLPWWFAPPERDDWEAILRSTLEAAPIAALLELLRQNKVSLSRFARQHRPAFQVELLGSLHSGLPLLLSFWKQVLRQELWPPWLLHCWNMAAAESPEALAAWLSRIPKTTIPINGEEVAGLFPPSARVPDPLRSQEHAFYLDKSLQTKPEYLYVHNAGLVILAPYLPAFLEQVGLVEAGEFISTEAIDRAAQLMHYLVFGAAGAQEYDLALEKVLCGTQDDYLPDANIELTENEQEEADALLKAVIENWAALGACSPPSLRAMFLQREGKLSPLGDDYLLQVEPQTADILLNRLPWGFSLIRLPWMPGFLHTEWIY